MKIIIDGAPTDAAAGSSVAAAMMAAGKSAFRTSVTGESRGPLCGMGICFECRVIINGVPHQRSCMVMCEEGMEVRTHE